MFGTAWLVYFEGNVRRACAAAPSLRAELPEALHAPQVAGDEGGR